MAVSDLVNLSDLMDDAKCFAFVRQRRWPEGIRCPACDNDAVTRDGHDDTQPFWQRYRCTAWTGRFDDLTGLDAALRHLPLGDRCAMVLVGHHQPLRVWVLCFHFIGLNLSNRQIALKLGLDASDVQAITEQLRHGLVAKAPAVKLTGEVEIDEVYVVAGRWCTRQINGEMAPNLWLLSDDRLATDGVRAPGRQHPVQHRHADGSLSLLGRKTAGSQTRSDQRLVTTHCRFH